MSKGTAMLRARSIRRSRQTANRRARRGAATVEFAVTAPFLFALLLGLIDVAQLANAGQSVTHASNLGARQAAKSSTDSVSDVQSCIASFFADRFPQLSDSDLDAALDVSVNDSSGNPIVGDELGATPTGAMLSVDVELDFDAVRWLDGVSLGEGQTLNTTTVVRRE